MTETKRKYFIFVILALLLFLTLNVGHPVTPAFMDEINMPNQYFGLLFAAMSLANIIFAPIWGRLGDKYGRKYFLIFGLIGYAVGQYLLVLTSNYGIIFFARFLSGLTIAATIVNFYAYILENTNNKVRAKVLSIIAGTNLIAVSLGYFIGGKLGMILGTKETFYFQSILSLLVGILLFVMFKKITIIEKERKGFFSNLKGLVKVKNKNVIIMLVFLIFITIAFTNTTKFLDLYIVTEKKYSTDDLGTFVFVTGIVSFFTSIIIIFLIKKFKDIFLVYSSLFLGGVALILTFVFNVDLMITLYSTFMIYVFFKTFYEPISLAYLSKESDLNNGELMGIRKSFQSIGNFIGPLIGTVIYAYNQSAVFIFAGVVLVLSGVLIKVLIKSKGDAINE